MNPPPRDVTPASRATPAPRENVLEFAELVEKLAEQHQLPGSKIRAILRGLFTMAAEGLKAGKSVRIRGLGMLHVREPAAGAARPGKRIVLSPEKPLKSAVDL